MSCVAQQLKLKSEEKIVEVRKGEKEREAADLMTERKRKRE